MRVEMLQAAWARRRTGPWPRRTSASRSWSARSDPCGGPSPSSPLSRSLRAAVPDPPGAAAVGARARVARRPSQAELPKAPPPAGSRLREINDPLQSSSGGRAAGCRRGLVFRVGRGQCQGKQNVPRAGPGSPLPRGPGRLVPNGERFTGPSRLLTRRPCLPRPASPGTRGSGSSVRLGRPAHVPRGTCATRARDRRAARGPGPPGLRRRRGAPAAVSRELSAPTGCPRRDHEACAAAAERVPNVAPAAPSRTVGGAGPSTRRSRYVEKTQGWRQGSAGMPRSERALITSPATVERGGFPPVAQRPRGTGASRLAPRRLLLVLPVGPPR